ncbi:hypothetical protein AOG26_04355 [Pseudoalteromonas sp. UCD-33C]|nr:hypothetical protein AOG26_04355 [Pseudoalteromonas sp. UCD-33C]
MVAKCELIGGKQNQVEKSEQVARFFYSYICLVKLDVGHREEGCANKLSFLFFKLQKFRISTQSGFEPPTFGVGHRER